MSKNMKSYEIITEKICSRIQDAIDNKKSFSWVKPWKGYPTGNYLQYLKNPTDFYGYRGINRLILDGGLYLTMKQINDLEEKDGAEYKVRKGSHAEAVYFYKPKRYEEKDKDGNTVLDEDGNPVIKQYLVFRYYNVFNVADVEGLDVSIDGIDTEYDETKLSKKADKIIKAYCKRAGLDFQQKKGTDKAYYRPATHEVIVPAKSQFKSLEEYYSTVFHELTHSTCKELGRDVTGNRKTQKYSFEELVAELGALFLMQEVGFDTSKTEINSTAYLKSWLKVLKDDVSFIVKASTQAQKAHDLILDIKMETGEETTNTEVEKEGVA